jgi:hypothetical protein
MPLRILQLGLRLIGLVTKARSNDGRATGMNRQSNRQEAQKRRLADALRQNLGQRKRQERLRREDSEAPETVHDCVQDDQAVVKSETMR